MKKKYILQPISRILSEQDKIEVIQYFLTNKNNSLPEMAKVFNTSEFKINRVINNYFKDVRSKIS